MNISGKAGERLPDFVVIGAAKSGTTSLINWLSAQPEVWPVRVKEPDFFSHDPIWRRGVGWYAEIFADAKLGLLCSEASTSYTEVRHAARAAERMARTIPDAKIIYVVRHPIERLRSHYRHEVQRGRERRTLARAVATPGNEYVGSSLYHTCLEPYTRVFPREQICVVRFEDVVDPSAKGWSSVIDHLGLPNRSQPGNIWNRTADKPGYTRTMLRLWELGLLRPSKHLPGPVRRLGRALLTRNEATYARRLEQSLAAVPPPVEVRIWADVEMLEQQLGVDGQWWPRDALG